MALVAAGALAAFAPHFTSPAGKPPATVRSAPTAAISPSPAPTAAPSPTARPRVTPVPHVRTGGITYILSRLQAIQAVADRGDPRFLYARDPVKVTLHDLPRYGFRGAPIAVVSPNPPEPAPTAHVNEHGLPETDVVVRFRGRKYWIVLDQFVRQGAGGIWSVMTITPM